MIQIRRDNRARFRTCLLLPPVGVIVLTIFVGCDQEARVADAVHKNDVPSLWLLLEHHPELLNAINKHGSTLLLDARSAQMAEFLVAKGANVNAKSRSGRTALHVAALRGQSKIVELLLQNGADVKATDTAGLTALHRAVRNGTLHVKRFGRGGSPYRGKDRIIELLLAAGADINAKTNSGRTPLHVAVTSGGTNEVRVLLSRGATVNEKDDNGQTPLHATAGATRHVHAAPITRLLLNHGSNMQARDKKHSWTPLHYAAEHGNLTVLRILIAKGADLNARDVYGWTPLHRGAYHADVLRLLLNKGADIDAMTKHGYTVMTLVTKPLMAEDRPEIVKILREHRRAEQTDGAVTQESAPSAAP